MNKISLLIVMIAFVIAIGIIFKGELGNNPRASDAVDTQNVEVRDGVQYITIQARGGYSPKNTTAQADLPTKLVVKTNGTYDCSSSLVIKSIGYQKILPQTGEEVIDLAVPQAGILQGLCSMGMYNFTIDFK